MQSLCATHQGQVAIKQAIERKGWTVQEGDIRPLTVASWVLVRDRARENGWSANDPRWLKEFEYFLRVEQGQTPSEIKKKLVQSQQDSLQDAIQVAIEQGEIFAKGVSFGSWQRFTSGQRVNAPAFKAYCQVLGLDWQAVFEGEIMNQPLSASPKNFPHHNLPVRDRAPVGRRAEIAQILKWLDFNHPAYRIGIEGIGGVGKTSLALEVAYCCLEEEPLSFEAIIFTCAQPQRLTSGYILPRLQREKTLQDIFRAIARTLNCLDSLPAEFEEQSLFVRDRLASQRTLLLIDNLETLAEQNIVLAFLYELPPTVKVVLTTRLQTLLDATLHLEPLPIETGIELIEAQIQQKDVPLSDRAVRELYQKTCGIPAVIVYSIGQLALHYPLSRVLERLSHPTEEIARYCFENAIALLPEQSAYPLLLALTFFSHPAVKSAIAAVAFSEPDEIAVDDGLAQLQQLSLVKNYRDRYGMLSLTRSYGIAQLQTHLEFEKDARERWLAWYLQFVRCYGWEDWQEWHCWDAIEAEWENLHDVLEWCFSQEKYENFIEFWRYIKGYSHFSGYWGDRLRWMKGLQTFAQHQQDWGILAESLFDRARTLIMFDRPQYQQQAKKLLDDAWDLAQTHTLSIQFEIGIYHIALNIYQQQFEVAQGWIETLTPQLATCESQPRWAILLSYYQGEICLKTGDCDRAQSHYQKALEQAQSLCWQRVTVYTQVWLANVAIQQKAFDRAERFLKDSLPAIAEHKDKRCLAFCYRSFALLENARENALQGREWGNRARQVFEELGMLEAVAQIESMLDA